jgi:hypothetical protein
MMKLSSEVPNFCRRIYKKSRRLIDLSGCWKSGFRHPATSTKKVKRPAMNLPGVFYWKTLAVPPEIKSLDHLLAWSRIVVQVVAICSRRKNNVD